MWDLILEEGGREAEEEKDGKGGEEKWRRRKSRADLKAMTNLVLLRVL